MRIAFDLDGVLADLNAALAAIAEELFPRAIDSAGGPTTPAAPGSRPQDTTPAETGPPDELAGDLTPVEERLEPPQVRALTRPQQHAIWESVRRTTGFWETLPETEPGIVARIAAVAEECRWEVIFLTQRPPAGGDTTQRQTQRWLARHGFELPSVFVLGGAASRGKVAAALDLDVVVDDRAENCLDVKADSQARAILVGRGQGANLAENAARLGIEVVASVADCLDLLTSSSRRPRSGLFERVKRLVSRT